MPFVGFELLIGLLVLLIIGALIIVLLKLLILFIPAFLLAAFVWIITGSMLLGGLAFLFVALLGLLRKL